MPQDSQPRLIHLLSANHWGGVARCVLDISRYLNSAGWSVTAYTRDARVVDDPLLAHGIDVRHAPLRGYFDPATVTQLAGDFAQEPEGTIVHVHRFRDAFTALAARKLSKRSDISVIMTRHRVKPGSDTWLMRRIYRNLRGIIFPSQLAMDRFLSTWHGKGLPTNREKFVMVRDSIMTGQPVAEPEKGPKVALYCGPIVAGKGLETLIDALPRLRGKRVRLQIAGGGDSSYVDTLRRRAIARGVMEMIDWKKDMTGAESIIRECHFGVLPSTEREASGIFAVECMALGRPVICSNNGACAEYVGDGREGLLVNPADAQALAYAMLRLAEDDETRRNMGIAARHAFEKELSWEGYIAAMTALTGKSVAPAASTLNS